MSTPYAKLTPPGLDRIYPRLRLFEALDALRTCPVVWISAPGGAGKTTLAASYLAEREITPLWYRVDPGDGDIASFFYYLGEGLKHLTGAHRRTLPLLTPEYQYGLPAFSRRFFRDLFAAMRTPAVLVLDNMETLHEDPLFNEVLCHGLEEIPPGGRVLITGRCLPPAQYARLQANGRLAQLGWDRLQLTDEESLGVIELLGDTPTLPGTTIRRMQDIAQGWMAGLVLLLNFHRPTSPSQTPDPAPTASSEGLSRQYFDGYFASEVFGLLPQPTRTLLLRTAWLTSPRADTAAALSGIAQAGAILRELEQNQMFVTGRGGTPPVYDYHPLLRAFLQAEAQRTLSLPALAELKNATARILAEEGQADEAATLYAQCENWPALARLIQTQAQALWEQGRFRLLRRWLDLLPSQWVADDPWLSYWYGNTALLSEPRQAGSHFETALRNFEAAGDTVGLSLCLTGILDGIIYGNDSLADVPHWLDVLDRLRRRFGPCPVPAVAIRLDFTAFNMQFLACPERATPEQWQALARRLETVVPEIADDTLHCMSASHLAMYYTWHPQPARLDLLADALYGYAVSERVPALARLIAYLVEITRRWVTARTTGSEDVIRASLRVMEEHGVYIGRLWLLSAAIFYYLSRRDLAAAENLLDQYRIHIRPHNRNEQAHYHFLAGWLAILQGDLERALAHAQAACTLIRPLHTPHFELLSRILHCLALIRLGRYTEGRRCIAETRRLAATAHARHIESFHLGLLEAWIAWQEEDVGTALDSLRMALACGRELCLRVSPAMDPGLLASLCALALEHGVETAYVRRLVQWNDLAMPARARFLPAWPMTVRIYTLGRFEVRVHGRAIARRPSHNKPLQLLHVLIAFGGRNVSDSRIEDALWPECDGHRALITNLQRLRRLLGVPQAIRYQDGRLSLDEKYCWVDVWAFDREPENDAPQDLVRLLALYQGAFLSDEGEAWWLLDARERLHARALRRHQRLQERLAAAGQWHDLADWCQRALHIDPLHEPFYQAQIRAHHHLGQYSQAMRAYRLCRQRLRKELGVEPAPETRALLQSSMRAMHRAS